jgi:hypothetical protein
VVSDFTVKGLSTVIVLKWQVLHSVSVLPVQFASEQLEFLIPKALCCIVHLHAAAATVSAFMSCSCENENVQCKIERSSKIEAR